MSSDDYDLHITQKYRLAISIAILNTKPKNLTIDEYIDKLKLIIDEKNMDNDLLNIDDDLNISACSDDFKVDNADVIDVCDDLNQHISHDIESLNRNEDIRYNNEVIDDVYVNDKNLQVNGTFNDIEPKTVNDNSEVSDRHNEKYPKVIYNEALYDDESKGNDNKTQSRDNETQFNGDAKDVTSITILHNFEEASETIDVNKDRRDKFREVIRVLKGVDVLPTDMVVNESQKIFLTNVQNIPFDPNNMDLTQCYDDNHTLNESINKLVNADKRTHEETLSLQDNLKLKQKEVTAAQQIHNTTNTSELHAKDTEISRDNAKEIKKIIKKRLNDNKISILKPKIAKTYNESNKNNAEKYTKVNNLNIIENNINSCNNRLNSLNNTDKYQIASIRENIATERKVKTSSNNSGQIVTNRDQSQIARDNATIYTEETVNTIPEYTQFNTHYSQSQMNEVVIDNKLIYAKKDTGIELNALLSSRNVNDTNKNSTKNGTAFLLNTPNINRESLAKIIIENDTILSTDIQNVNSNKDQDIEFTENEINSKNNHNIIALANEKLDNTNNGCTVSDKTDIENTDVNLDTDVEKIPFKIIENMNIMKMYLKKKESKEYSSGYKSSQTKCSFGSSQSQNGNVSEPAHSVFNYLSNCSLVTATQELIEQLAEVLGKVIDRLHEEETYPPFLEEILDNISKLLKLIHEADNYDFNVLLKKDEQIQRIILLNKSTHIQKYTIEKINCILQKLLDNKSADNPTQEIQNINQLENLCYIFHILHIILPKYYINSQNSTQNSQDQKILRKNDISELWRKKWISNEKKVSIEGSVKNNCVLTDCRAILNKIIVDFIDEYSLIAFSALTCFNIMQS